ncbi:phosphopantothenoylcysteine decarboxylase subunit VHS3-like [Arachis ipaensis]|uniref:phosphopantothenoylcysteine decarboxylase subunit VHS3-like n=1 Tax=Arachis ipaensis TaxID=130454 RepID=UPI0007AEF96D|nr:phosphopantothenoylcysteine decarboxylase subunit VHS3-like [Arachis ipaensis]XP_025685571.1 phosphopantothenoylcysteine decarboxylase subunit VHS3-like [Arachis hypogaea]
MATEAGQSQSCNLSEVPPPKSTYLNVLTQGQRSLDTRIRFRSPSENSGGRLSVDSSRSDGGRGIINSGNSRCIQMGLIEESMRDNDIDDVDYLEDSPEGDDEDDDDDDEEEKDNEVDDGGHGKDNDWGDDPGPSTG